MPVTAAAPLDSGPPVPKSYAPLVATAFVIGVSAFANVVTINGYRTGQISDLYPTGFTPAGWVFSIWSAIYVGLFSFSLSQVLGSSAVKARGAPLRGLFVVNAAANCMWIFAWHYRHLEASLAVMLVVLGTLIAIRLKLTKMPRPSLGELACVDAPFRLYFGWITTATIANLGAVLSARQSYPFGVSMDSWALVSVVSAIAVYVAVGVVTKDAIYCGVFVWAAVGIFLKPSGISEPVRIAAITGAVLVLLVAVTVLVTRRWRGPERAVELSRP